ncbi:MAG TPA: glycosyltransferase family 4 protein [Pedobacter sp.]
MKILFLSHFFYPKIGGVEVNSDLLANAFHKLGHEIRLVTWSEDPGNKPFDFPVIRNPGLRILIREHLWADIVFENNPCLRLAWPAFFLGKPSVVALCTWISRSDGRKGWQDRIKNLWLRRAAKVIAVSKVIRDECFPAAIVIGNPYGTAIFKKSPVAVRDHDFVFLGRLVSDKGADMAIKAIDALLKGPGHLAMTLTIIGEGDEMNNLKELVRVYGLETLVTFTGSLRGDVLVATLNEHRYMLIPSIWKEPFGNVALEGMACGCIPIVSDGGGLPDAVGNAGLVFERGNTDSLLRTIRTLLENRELEKELRANAYTHLDNHHPDVISAKYLDVLENVIQH